MAAISIRDVSDDVYAALKAKASAANMGLETWLRSQLEKLATEPMVRERYALRFYNDEGDASGTIRRLSNDLNGVGGGCSNLSEEAFKAYKKAQDVIRRNEPGDREKAYQLLRDHFDNVFEVPV
jgi:hypothetical protein